VAWQRAASPAMPTAAAGLGAAASGRHPPAWCHRVYWAQKKSPQSPEQLWDLDTPRGPPKAGAFQTCPAKNLCSPGGQRARSRSRAPVLIPASSGDTDVTSPAALLSPLLRGAPGCSGIRCPLAFQTCPLPAVACPCFPATTLAPAPENDLQKLWLPLLPKSSHGNTGKGFYF